MRFQSLNDICLLPLGPDDMSLVNVRKKGIVRKCEPVSPLQDRLNKLVIVARGINKKLVR
jgi:hypothetical protein